MQRTVVEAGLNLQLLDWIAALQRGDSVVVAVEFGVTGLVGGGHFDGDVRAFDFLAVDAQVQHAIEPDLHILLKGLCTVQHRLRSCTITTFLPINMLCVEAGLSVMIFRHRRQAWSNNQKLSFCTASEPGRARLVTPVSIEAQPLTPHFQSGQHIGIKANGRRHFPGRLLRTPDAAFLGQRRPNRNGSAFAHQHRLRPERAFFVRIEQPTFGRRFYTWTGQVRQRPGPGVEEIQAGNRSNSGSVMPSDLRGRARETREDQARDLGALAGPTPLS